LSADGTLYTCLFAASGTQLRPALRAGASDADLVGLLQNTWRHRQDRYSELRGKLLEHKPADGEKPERVEMYRMGG
jgi:cyclic pyranopterin phosphate synthase